MGTFVADFETTTLKEDCRVWAYAVVEVSNPDNLIIGTTLDEFMEWCQSRKENDTVLFHNLKFDAQAIIYWLLTNGYQHTTEKADRQTKTFNTSISHKNLYYSIEVIFKKVGKKINKVVFQDSLKLIPLSVKEIAQSFKLPISKLEIDYHAHNYLPVGAALTDIEKEYIENDVKIVGHAVDYFHKQGLNKMTIGACALAEFKRLLNSDGLAKYDNANFEEFFPPPEYHDDVKQAYRGGFTYLNPKYAGKMVSDGLVFDVNSLYPSVMKGTQLPFGTPRFFEGKYEYDPIYPLYVQMIRCQFQLKPGKLPMIQLKDVPGFKGTEYLTSSRDQDGIDVEQVLCLTSVDLELFLDHYETYNLEYISGWRFKSTEGFFDDYIDKWTNEKIAAKERGDHGMYLISKLFLNSLYGKFGSDTRDQQKIPVLGDDGVVHYLDGDKKKKKPVYVPMAAFITSYARKKTIDAAQKIMDNNRLGLSKAQFVYCDTDSLHIVLNGESEETFIANCGLDIHPTKLGAWDHEASFCRAKFLRAKCYIEKHVMTKEKYEDALMYCEDDERHLFSHDKDGYCKLAITVAGMPQACYEGVTFRNFKIGAKYKGKKSPHVVPGGVVLDDVDFTIKDTAFIGY